MSVSLFDWMHEFAILHTNVRVSCRCACLLGNVGSRLVRAVSFIGFIISATAYVHV